MGQIEYTHSDHPGQSGAGCEKPTKRYLHETRNTWFIFDICSFLNSLCLLGLKLFSVPLHLIPLAQAIAEIGRIDKTIHALHYINDEARRRSTLAQLNLGEGRHSLARNVFHGKRGQLHQRYREGQEDQLSALGLVVNMIVLWNTLYMNAVLDQLRQEGYRVRPIDEARLSPFGHEHINFLGRYSFAVPEAVTRGELRPLRTVGDA